jgi:hypothetical protein
MYLCQVQSTTVYCSLRHGISSGIQGFWKDSSMRLGRLLLSGGIVFSDYEEAAAILSLGTRR